MTLCSNCNAFVYCVKIGSHSSKTCEAYQITVGDISDETIPCKNVHISVGLYFTLKFSKMIISSQQTITYFSRQFIHGSLLVNKCLNNIKSDISKDFTTILARSNKVLFLNLMNFVVFYNYI